MIWTIIGFIVNASLVASIFFVLWWHDAMLTRQRDSLQKLERDTKGVDWIFERQARLDQQIQALANHLGVAIIEDIPPLSKGYIVRPTNKVPVAARHLGDI